MRCVSALTDTRRRRGRRSRRLLVTLAAGQARRPLGRAPQVRLTHEQLATLAATSRETTTKILGEFADRGLISIGRGRMTILDAQALEKLSGSR